MKLVPDMQKVEINGVVKNFYSFATKYCSHHNPLDYTIYDSYVDKNITWLGYPKVVMILLTTRLLCVQIATGRCMLLQIRMKLLF